MIRVLIADDQPVIRTGFSVIAEAEGDITVMGHAADGAAAVRLTRELNPDVVLMDVRMPGIDGLEATARLRDSGAAVIVVTTFNLDEYVFGALDAGAVGFLLKDASDDDLVGAIRAAARGEGLVGAAVTRRVIAEFTRRAPAVGTEPRHDPTDLSDRERELVVALADGLSNAEIAERLTIEVSTVKSHLARITGRFGMRDRVQLVVWAYRCGLVR